MTRRAKSNERSAISVIEGFLDSLQAQSQQMIGVRTDPGRTHYVHSLEDSAEAALDSVYQRAMRQAGRANVSTLIGRVSRGPYSQENVYLSPRGGLVMSRQRPLPEDAYVIFHIVPGMENVERLVNHSMLRPLTTTPVTAPMGPGVQPVAQEPPRKPPLEKLELGPRVLIRRPTKKK